MSRWTLDRWEKALLSAIVLVSLATALGGCGHREKVAPCSQSEGAIRSYAPMPRFGPIPVIDNCGPLRSLNGRPLTGTAAEMGIAPRLSGVPWSPEEFGEGVP
ncbi:MAG: hypothetical protein ACRCUC_17335 [Aestuariivirga sp.]